MIPSASHDGLLAAMELFDQEYRQTNEWRQWEQNRTHKFAVEHAGRLYPVKEIISLAAQVPVSGFSGGDEANAYVRRYGFGVVPLSETPGSDRASAEAARIAVERMFPAPDQRRFCLSVLADSIVAGNSVGAGTWGVSLTREIDVNVGHVVVCAVRAKGIWLALDKASLSDKAQASLGEEWYKSLPNITGLEISPEASADLVSMVWDAHLAFLKRAAAPFEQINSRSQAAHSPGVLAYLRSELGRDIPEPAFGSSSTADSAPPARNVWWVNQGRTFTKGLRAQTLWAPLKGAKGRHVPHWDRMREVCQGDVIVHNGANAIRAISLVTRDAYPAPRPADHPASSGETMWSHDGTQVDAKYFEFRPIIPVDKMAPQLKALNIIDGPLNKNGGPKEGYLFRLTTEALQILQALAGYDWPIWIDETTSRQPVASPSEPEPPTMPFTTTLESLRKEGLFFSDELISNYLLTLQTKRFVILSGISGTGKTKLALAVARHYPTQARVAAEQGIESGAVRLRVRPYSLKYHRIQLPVSFTRNMQFPPLDDGRSTTVRVHYPGGDADQSLYVDNQPGRNAIALLFSGDVWKWFDAHLHEGDHFSLDLVPSEGGPDALRIDLPQRTQPRTEERDTYVTIAVRPDWTDNRGLIGYYNPITAQYHTTPFLSLLLEAAAEEVRATQENRPPHPYFLILDEMNLARVEHYFSDFLSCLESGEPLHLHDSPALDPDEDQEGPSVPQLLPIPKNVFFTGTVNVDETTSMFSPKVVDRAFTLEFNSVDLAGYGAALPAGSAPSPLALKGLPAPLQYRGNPGSADWQALGVRDSESRQTLVALHRLLSECNRHFGYRVANEIARFLNLAAEQTDDTPDSRKAALDLAVLQKVLPKFHGTQQELQTVLGLLFSFAVAGKTGVAHTAADWRLSEGVLTPMGGSAAALALPRTAAKLWRMLERLQEQGFTSFME